MSKIILIGSCMQCPFHKEEQLTGKVYCNNQELVEHGKKIPKKVCNINKVPKWCPLMDLDILQGV